LVDAKLAAKGAFFGGGGLGGALGGGGGFDDGMGAGTLTLTLDSVTAERTSMRCPHLRHFIRTVLPTTFSSAI
jgi:hypothetical protein